MPRSQPAAAPAFGAATPGDRYLSRELSRLEFNARVLSLAEDDRLPLLERVKFLAIFAGNLDDFYQVRVATLRGQQAAALESTSADGLSAGDRLDLISRRVVELADRHALLFGETIRPALARAGIRIVSWQELDEPARGELATFFSERIFPVLTPLAVDPGHPFPYISNLSLNLAVTLRERSDRRRRFARLKIPPLLPRFLPVTSSRDGSTTLVPIEEVVATNLERLFPGMTILEHHTFRVTRHNDLEIDDDEAEDLLRAIEQQLRRRRSTQAVRLEVESTMSAGVQKLLMRELQLEERDVHRLPAPLGLADLWSIHEIPRPDLKDPPFVPRLPASLHAADEEVPSFFPVLRENDVLVHHPYDSFSASVQAFIEEAAADPHVLAIKQTLYRTSGESPIVDALVQAAELGKQVVVLVEVKARGDEPANVSWARTLERAGCHVVYGLMGLKTHAKLCLVVREEGAGLRRYVHIGTGNYHPATARIYEDLGLLTANPTLAGDVSHLFNLITGYSRRSEYDSLMVAPINLRRRMIEMIEREGAASSRGRQGRIVWKLNGLDDEAIIDALYEAGRQGTRIDLVVRGVCALRPGVPGLSETITVRSIVGRFLEHSRVYRFGEGDEGEIWIGSADMMHRNLDRRVETLVRVDDVASRRRLDSMLALALADTAGSWQLRPDGHWERLSPAPGDEAVSLQATLLEAASADA